MRMRAIILVLCLLPGCAERGPRHEGRVECVAGVTLGVTGVSLKATPETKQRRERAPVIALTNEAGVFAFASLLPETKYHIEMNDSRFLGTRLAVTTGHNATTLADNPVWIVPVPPDGDGVWHYDSGSREPRNVIAGSSIVSVIEYRNKVGNTKAVRFGGRWGEGSSLFAVSEGDAQSLGIRLPASGLLLFGKSVVKEVVPLFLVGPKVPGGGVPIERAWYCHARDVENDGGGTIKPKWEHSRSVQIAALLKPGSGAVFSNPDHGIRGLDLSKLPSGTYLFTTSHREGRIEYSGGYDSPIPAAGFVCIKP